MEELIAKIWVFAGFFLLAGGQSDMALVKVLLKKKKKKANSLIFLKNKTNQTTDDRFLA